jgi:hypothetical protein
MATTLNVRRDSDGVLTTLPLAPECAGCGVEAEVTSYRVRTCARDGEPVKVRVGFKCTCGFVTIDGMCVGTAQ